MNSVVEVGPGYMSILPEIPELHERMSVPRIAVFSDTLITEWDDPDFEGIPIVCADIYKPATVAQLQQVSSPALLAMFDVVNDPTYPYQKNFIGLSQWCKNVLCPRGLLILTDTISSLSKQQELYPTVNKHLLETGFTPVYPHHSHRDSSLMKLHPEATRSVH
jgi:hypothetical protein